MIEGSLRSSSQNLDLIERCRAGDSIAQFDIYKLYYKTMFNTCLRIIPDKMEAEDIMQEAFLTAFNKLNTYKGEVTFGAWLKKIVINRAIDARRKIIKYPNEELNKRHELQENEDAELLAEDIDKVNYRVEEIKQILDHLPHGYREIASLYLFEGYDHEEIAQVMSIPASTSRSMLSRAKQMMREKLKNVNT